MELPTTFTLAGRKWRVRLVRPRTMRKMAGTQAFGYCNYDKARISICDNLDEDMTWISFEHELEHAIDFTRGVMEQDEVAVDGRANMRNEFRKTKKPA